MWGVCNKISGIQYNNRGKIMVSFKMKIKVLMLLSEGPQTKTLIGDIFKNRTAEYKAELNEWLSGVVSDSYTINYHGPATTLYCITPAGVDELEQLKTKLSDLG